MVEERNLKGNFYAVAGLVIKALLAWIRRTKDASSNLGSVGVWYGVLREIWNRNWSGICYMHWNRNCVMKLDIGTRIFEGVWVKSWKIWNGIWLWGGMKSWKKSGIGTGQLTGICDRHWTRNWAIEFIRNWNRVCYRIWDLWASMGEVLMNLECDLVMRCYRNWDRTWDLWGSMG